jgi:hypothetical protein
MTDEILDNPTFGSGDQTAIATNIINTAEPLVPVAPQTWPDNWRQEMAGNDEKELKRLERMKSPADVYKSYREIEKLKSSFTPIPKKPTAESTPEEVKAYRDHLGIPETFDKYDLSFDDGTAVGEDLMPQVNGFLQYAHEHNIPPEFVKGPLKFFLDDVAREKEAIAERNDEARIEGSAKLRAEWGNAEYKGNINAIQSLFTDAPEGTMDRLLNAADSSGLKFANNADNIRWLVGLAKTINPTASLLPAGANDAAGIETELAKLQSQMNSHDSVERNKYWKDQKAQSRYLELTKAKQNSR